MKLKQLALATVGLTVLGSGIVGAADRVAPLGPVQLQEQARDQVRMSDRAATSWIGTEARIQDRVLLKSQEQQQNRFRNTYRSEQATRYGQGFGSRGGMQRGGASAAEFGARGGR
jgi:hypothetical protein